MVGREPIIKLSCGCVFHYDCVLEHIRKVEDRIDVAKTNRVWDIKSDEDGRTRGRILTDTNALSVVGKRLNRVKLQKLHNRFQNYLFYNGGLLDRHNLQNV